jgi:hypothetical protein
MGRGESTGKGFQNRAVGFGQGTAKDGDLHGPKYHNNIMYVCANH